MELVMDAIAAFAVAMFSGMGLGSGGFFVIYLTLFTAREQLTSQYLNLIFFIFSAGAAMLYHVMRRNILWNAVIILVIFGVIGSLPGSALATVLPPSLMRKSFGIFLLGAGFLSLFGKKANAGAK